MEYEIRIQPKDGYTFMLNDNQLIIADLITGQQVYDINLAYIEVTGVNRVVHTENETFKCAKCRSNFDVENMFQMKFRKSGKQLKLKNFCFEHFCEAIVMTFPLPLFNQLRKNWNIVLEKRSLTIDLLPNQNTDIPQNLKNSKKKVTK